MTHIATVQLQDYYQHKVFEAVVTRRHWSRFESRLRRNVELTLELFSRFGVRATFFTLGWIAEQFPDLLAEVGREGHEIACAGYWGVDRRTVSQTEFRTDIRLGKHALERAVGHRIDGYRCVRRSFSDKELWLVDLVAEEDFHYDSSLMPNGFAGTAFDTRHPFVRETRRGPVHEIPHSTQSVMGYRVPIGGGNFLRQLPQRLMFRAFLRWIRGADAPFVLYFHPWELDADIPDVSAFDRVTHVRQYRNLGKLRDILPRYFEEAAFGTAREYLQLAPPSTDVASSETAAFPETERIAGAVGSVSRTPVTVVIPCHNEEAAIPYLSRALDELTASAARLYQLRYLFVDDKSTDGTVTLLKRTFPDSGRHKVIELSQNLGVSGAIQAGIDAAETEIVCSIDADCSYDPLELLNMIPLLDTHTALVTASPYHEEGTVLGVPGWRLFLSRGLSGIYRIFLNHKLATYTSCFRVYRRSVVQHWKPEHGDFRGIVELLARLDMAGQRIKEYPTTLQSRLFGFSKMKTLKTIQAHLRLLGRMVGYHKEHQQTDGNIRG